MNILLNEPPERPSAPTKPRVLVVYAHPNPKSYTHAVLEVVQAGLGERCEVQTLDLYATGFDPVLVVDETRRRRDLDQVEETRALREQLAWCDAMLFVYPVWWGGFPAMLNGYLDRTFVSGLTYSFEGRPRTAVFPHGLMRDKEAHLFYTLDSPWLFALLDPGWFSNLLTVFWYCGFRRVRRYYLARLKIRTDEQRARWLVTVREHAGRIAERLPAGRVLAGCLNNNAHQGRDLGDNVEIVSGLNPTESLVANPTDALRDGSEVKVQAQPSKGSDQQVNAKPTEKKS